MQTGWQLTGNFITGFQTNCFAHTNWEPSVDIIVRSVRNISNINEDTDCDLRESVIYTNAGKWAEFCKVRREVQLSQNTRGCGTFLEVGSAISYRSGNSREFG